MVIHDIENNRIYLLCDCGYESVGWEVTRAGGLDAKS